jgi:hypothetical protein
VGKKVRAHVKAGNRSKQREEDAREFVIVEDHNNIDRMEHREGKGCDEGIGVQL